MQSSKVGAVGSVIAIRSSDKEGVDGQTIVILRRPICKHFPIVLAESAAGA